VLVLDPSFLTKQLGYTAGQQTVTSVIYNIGAIMGGTIVGYFSQYFGRKRSIIVCAIVGGAIIPLWAFAPSIASLQFGAWLMQFCVQGAWGKRNRKKIVSGQQTTLGIMYQQPNNSLSIKRCHTCSLD
jgi:MFS family permease